MPGVVCCGTDGPDHTAAFLTPKGPIRRIFHNPPAYLHKRMREVNGRIGLSSSVKVFESNIPVAGVSELRNSASKATFWMHAVRRDSSADNAAH
jgi:hypothetical protein